MIFSQVLSSYQKLFFERYNLSSTIRHRGEKGRQRENGLLVFLREMLPAAYGVATGEIIPYQGSVASPQCDIIIYDRLHMPIIGINDAVQQVPLEAVYAVIECKSRIDSTALKDAERKLLAIRKLPRCPSERPLREKTSSDPLFFVFGYQIDTTHKRCTNFCKKVALHSEVNVVSLDSGCSIWISQKDKPDVCCWINATSQEQNLYETLVIFYICLLDGLREIDLGTPSYSRMVYFGG